MVCADPDIQPVGLKCDGRMAQPGRDSEDERVKLVESRSKTCRPAASW